MFIFLNYCLLIIYSNIVLLSMPTSVCVLLCVHFFSCLLFVGVLLVFIPAFLSSHPWFFGFLVLLSMSGRSSSEALKEEKEVPPLCSPSYKGRFQVGPITYLGFVTHYSQSLLYCGQTVNVGVLCRLVTSGDSSTQLLSAKRHVIKPWWYSQESGTLFRHQGGGSEGGLADRQLPCVS